MITKMIVNPPPELLRLVEQETEWVHATYGRHNFIDEKRISIVRHRQLYQRRMKRAFDKKVHPRGLREGELVMKKIISIQKDSREKWMPNYKGPYVVNEG